MQAIGRLRRGGLSRQFFAPTRPGRPRRGPYYVLQGSCRGRKFSQRVPADQAPQIQQDVEHYRRFQALAEAYITVTDQLTRALDAAPDTKKNSSPRRSPTSSSAKPPPS